MKKALFILVAATLLTGCGNRVNDGEASSDDFAVACLDGVEYWVRVTSHTGFLAVRIDPETLQPARCERRVR